MCTRALGIVGGLFAVLGLLAAAWWFLAPASVGGRATYVVTHGTSMQPRFQTGDLALVHPASSYRIGDVVAYRSQTLDTTVLHRIVGKTSQGYLFKGDNNTWIDPDAPSRQQIVGRLALRVPKGGIVLDWINRPAVTAFLAVAILTAGATSATTRRRRARRRARAEKAPPMPSPFIARSAGWPRPALAGMAAVVFAALAGATYVAPGERDHSERVPWTTTVEYGYTADVSPNLVYPDGRVHAGQTVFRKLVDRLTVHATWSLQSSASHRLRGTGTLEAVVQGPNGWTHSIPLGHPSAFASDNAVLSGELDLHALDDLVARAGRLAGVTTSQFTVLVRPTVKLAGTIAGTPVPSAPRPDTPLAFAVTPSTVTLARSTPVAGSDSAARDQRPTPAEQATSSTSLKPAPTTNLLTVPRVGPATWPILGYDVAVDVSRWIGITGAVLSLLAAIALASSKAPKDPCAGQLRRHRRFVISVSDLHVPVMSNVVELTTMAGLIDVARRYDRLILHQSTTGRYLVEDESGVYRFQCTHRPATNSTGQHLADRALHSELTSKSA